MIAKYSVERIRPHKQYAIWGVSSTRNSMFPLCYLQKPKHMSEENYQKVVQAIRLDATKDFLSSEE